MNFTGFTVRYFTAIRSGNFLFEEIKTDALEQISGQDHFGKEMRIGFTGITGNTSWYFSLLNGNIYDPEGRVFSSYDADSLFSISGNFDTGNYDYYLDETIINAKGQKIDENFNGWFVECISGASGQCRIEVTTAPITTTLTMSSGFYTSGLWSGSFSHNHTEPIVIRSGELFLPDSVYFAITGSGLDFLTGHNVVGEGQYRTVYLVHTGYYDITGIFNVGMRIYTDFGFSDFRFSGSGVSQIGGYVFNNFAPTEGDVMAEYSDLTTTGVLNYQFSTNYLDFDGSPLNKNVKLTLLYTGGYTGECSIIEDITITSNGVNYASPIVYISPLDGGYPISSGEGLLNATNGITGVAWISSGVYTGDRLRYSVAVEEEGESGEYFSGTIVWGLLYDKSFSGILQCWTGAFGSGQALCNKNAVAWSGIGTLLANDNILDINLVNSGTRDTLSLGYLLTVSGFPDCLTNQYLYSGSGTIYSTNISYNF